MGGACKVGRAQWEGHARWVGHNVVSVVLLKECAGGGGGGGEGAALNYTPIRGQVCACYSL